MPALRHLVLQRVLRQVPAQHAWRGALHERRVQARLRRRVPGHAPVPHLAAVQVQGAPGARAAGPGDGAAARLPGHPGQLPARQGPATRAGGAGRPAPGDATATPARGHRGRAGAQPHRGAGAQQLHAPGRGRRGGRRRAPPVRARLPHGRLPRLPEHRLEVRHVRDVGVQGLRRAQAGGPARRGARVRPGGGRQPRVAAARQPALPPVRRHDLQDRRLRSGERRLHGRGGAQGCGRC